MKTSNQTSGQKGRLGWFCSYTPLEILYSAGVTPVRITGHSEPIQTEYMHVNLCQYVRSCIDAAVSNKLGDLEGVVFVNSCDAMRRLCDVWNQYVSPKFSFILDLPTGQTPIDVDYYLEEIQKLKGALEKHFKIQITDQLLNQSAIIYNDARALYRQLDELRKRIPASITGKEMLDIASKFFTTSPEKWIEEMNAILNQPRPDIDQKPRLFIAGSPIHNPEIVGFIEECGFDVVGEEICSGERFFDMSVDVKGEMMKALASAYLLKPTCARMMNLPERVNRIVSGARNAKADGILHHTLKFCDTYAYDVPALKKELDAAGFKMLSIEGDCTLGSMNQLKTRIEAFREVLINQ